MADISMLTKLFSSLESESLSIYPERCVEVRHRKAVCSRCIEACPKDAIAIKAGAGLQVDPDLCIGCGVCATPCPTEAIETIAPSSIDLLKMALDVLSLTEDTIVFACENGIPKRGYDGTRIVKVPCIGRIDETVLVGCALGGAKSVVLIDGPCESCPLQSCRKLADETAETANYLLEAFGSKPIASFEAALPDSLKIGRFSSRPTEVTDNSDRRDFFGQMKTNTKSLIYDIAAESIPLDLTPEESQTAPTITDKLRVTDGRMSIHTVVRRDRLLGYLDRIGSPVQDTIVTSLWGMVSIDSEACNSCRMCSTFCPTGALSRVDEDGFFGLEFLAADCVNCRLCETVCLKDALTVSDEVPLSTLIQLETMRFKMDSANDSSGMRFDAAHGRTWKK